MVPLSACLVYNLVKYSGAHESKVMDGKGLRERKCKESHEDHEYNDHNVEIQQCSEKEKSKKTCGRTPDGTSESSI